MTKHTIKPTFFKNKGKKNWTYTHIVFVTRYFVWYQKNIVFVTLFFNI